ncbi:hypothetical protein HK100_003145 [Physocladia obscura]|uniref:F-box domain-containing protein n=1 Tax=Physocladia obscura TaxID=109957 RepID=A0AAD5T0C9_9FUNG|nr:hypothetical protein HK100_003145 [Physocladia obscura]
MNRVAPITLSEPHINSAKKILSKQSTSILEISRGKASFSRFIQNSTPKETPPLNEKAKTSISDLPFEVVVRILAWIPALKLVSLRRLSKSFSACILANFTQFVPRMQGLVTVSNEPSEWEETVFNISEPCQSAILNKVFESMAIVRWNMPGPYILNVEYMRTIRRKLSAIPKYFGSIYSLRVLHLNSCSLRGPIPSSLYLLSQLKVLGLGNNELKGEIDARVGNLIHLEELWLHHNDLTGIIPPEIGQCKLLKIFQVMGNNLTGQIPSEIGKCKYLLTFEVGMNDLSGTIPKEIFSCSELEYFGAAQNQFTGSIPHEILRCENLVTFEIYANKYHLSVPRDIKHLPFFKRNGSFENTVWWRNQFFVK